MRNELKVSLVAGDGLKHTKGSGGRFIRVKAGADAGEKTEKPLQPYGIGETRKLYGSGGGRRTLKPKSELEKNKG